MRFRLLHVLGLLCIGLGVCAGAARALDFDDEDPEPPHGEVGAVYSYLIGSHAGCLPHRLEVIQGQLPPGLSIRRIALDKHVVEGIPTQEGEFSAWIALRDCDNKSSEALFTFDIWARRWSISTNSLKPAVAGAPYASKLEGSGPDSDVTWEITSGALPAGLTLSPQGGISGTATAAATATFTVKGTAVEKNFGPTRVDSRELALNVLAPLAAQISRTTAEAKAPFRATLVTTGGQAPYSWSATATPPGLRVGADGVVSGSPRKAGVYTLTARVTDATGATSDLKVRLVVRPHLTIATSALRAATAGHAYRFRLAATGGVEGTTWSLAGGTLPRGLRLSTTGTLSGTPAGAGSFRLTLRIRDALGATATKALVLNVR